MVGYGRTYSVVGLVTWSRFGVELLRLMLGFKSEIRLRLGFKDKISMVDGVAGVKVEHDLLGMKLRWLIGLVR